MQQHYAVRPASVTAPVPCRALMAEITVAFQVCSETINKAEAGLRKEDQHDLADMLRVVQTNEHEKLRLILILQALQQSYSCRKFSWNSRSSENSIQAATGLLLWLVITVLPLSRCLVQLAWKLECCSWFRCTKECLPMLYCS